MRLLHAHTLDISEFLPNQIPNYAILSHRWTREESTLREVQRKHHADTIKAGYKKVTGFAQYVKTHLPHIEWVWIDTCCINKESDAELSTAINSMCEWYRKADLCLAYLEDVQTSSDLDTFRKSVWFRRGWTLQELLAPHTVVFLTQYWNVIGHKGTGRGKSGIEVDSGPSLTPSLVAATGIPEAALNDFAQIDGFTVEERLQWAAGRETTFEEDMSYCLIGLFDLTMAVRYGEGGKKANRRLLAKIQKERELQQFPPPLPNHSDQHQKIIDWLSAPDPRTNHAAARQRHEAGTGLWLLESRQYQGWKDSPSGHLWLSGKAGCGKTIICSLVIEDIRAYCETQAQIAHATFYFSFSDTRKQSFENVLRSLVVQLALVEPSLSRLRQSYERPNASVPGPHELEDIIMLAVKSYRNVFLLLDALDECPDGDTGDTRQAVLQFLERLTRQATNVKIFATGREMPDITDSMSVIDASRIIATEQQVDGDIRRYVSMQMTRDSRLRRFSDDSKTMVADVFAERAGGMFRWAFCQLEELKKLKSTKPSRVRETLRTLPVSLDETYERMLAAIGEAYHDEALMILNWLAYVPSPPTISELTEVTVINLENDTVDMDDRGSPEDLLDLLAGLITIDTSAEDEYSDDGEDDSSMSSDDSGDGDVLLQNDYDGYDGQQSRMNIGNNTKVRLAHYSVKEYLESERLAGTEFKKFHLNERDGNRLLAQCCLIYLISYSRSLKKVSTRADLSEFPLLQYAAQTWLYHSFIQQPGGISREKAFLCSDSARKDWLLVHQPDAPWRAAFEPVLKPGSAVYCASFGGLERVVRELVTSGWEFDSFGGYYHKALQAASVKGFTNVVKILIEAGADVNAWGSTHGNALQAASGAGHEDIVKMLIQGGADLNARAGGMYDNALNAAAKAGAEKVVKMLLESGADVNAQEGLSNTALHTASLEGHNSIVMMLIQAGADVNALGAYNTPLQAAALNGHEKIVQMLIDGGADVNAQGPYHTALQAASLPGHEKVVKILIENGADVNAEGGYHGTALYAASGANREQTVNLLLKNGSDVNAIGGSFHTPLQAASWGGYENVVRRLLDGGADVNTQGGHLCGNALQAAAEGGHDTVVKMLIESGADVSAVGGRNNNALRAAASEGHPIVVKMLIEAGADVNAPGGNNGNALQAALRGGHREVVKILIDSGAIA